MPGLRVVALSSVTSAELEALWQYEAGWWRAQLLWDIADTQAALRRVVERRGLPGKAVQVAAQTVGYAYYGTVGSLGFIAGLQVLPEWNQPVLGTRLLQEVIPAIRQPPVSRIESSCLVPNYSWLLPGFTQHGFQAYWRDFLRMTLEHPSATIPAPLMVELEAWQGTHLREAALIMQAAYTTSTETESNALYRTEEGCWLVLDQLLNQGGCGQPVAAASALVRYRGQGIGFIVVTETAPHHGHLAQVAVLPSYQHRGIGRWLVQYSIARLTAQRFATLSLFVSRSNQRAQALYQAVGLRSVFTFPVLVWEQSKRDP